MKIIYIGNFRPTHSTETHIACSLENLDHEVVRLQEDETDFDEIDRLSKDAKFVLYTCTRDVIRGNRERWLKQKIVPLVGIHLDIWFGLKREVRIRRGLFFQSDYLFTADGGHQNEFKRLGKRHFWLPPAVVADEVYIYPPAYHRFVHDIIFVGSYRYHEEYPTRPELINWLSRAYGPRFRNYDHDSAVWGDKLNQLYSSTKIVIGDSLDSPRYWSDRIPETMGRGGFLMHPTNKDLDGHYKAGVHYVSYERGDYDELEALIEYYLANEDEREKIRLQGHKHVKNNHTYTHRMREMLKILDGEL